jgi:transketolase
MEFTDPVSEGETCRRRSLTVAALVADDIKQLKVSAGFNPEDSFAVPEAVYELYKTTFRQRGEKANRSWDASFQQYAAKYQDDHQELTRRITGQLPPNWEQLLPVYGEGDAAVGGRKYSEVILNALAPSLPELLGGSADLTSSNYTRVKNAEDFQAPSTGLGSYRGQYIRYGVREHAMGAIMNGISAYGLFIPFAGTFLNFVSDAIWW